MNSIAAGVKREYWEHRNIIVGLPLVMSVLFIIAAISAMIGMTYFDVEAKVSPSLQYQNNREANTLNSEPSISPDGDNSALTGSKSDRNDSEEKEESPPTQDQPESSSENEEITAFGVIATFIGASWVACLYYLLSCLYTDRKDKSVLFWKSLPVSETQNVLTKFLVACVGFVAVAIVIAWLTCIVFYILGLVANNLDIGHTRHDAGMDVSVAGVLLWPLASLLTGLVWGAPLFAYVLMISAAARRSPFMLLILPPLVLLVLERIFFGTSYFIGFVGQHLPFGVFGNIANSDNSAAFLQFYLLENGPSLVLGLALAAGFIALAIWFRNNRFEI